MGYLKELVEEISNKENDLKGKLITTEADLKSIKQNFDKFSKIIEHLSNVYDSNKEMNKLVYDLEMNHEEISNNLEEMQKDFKKLRLLLNRMNHEKK